MVDDEFLRSFQRSSRWVIGGTIGGAVASYVINSNLIAAVPVILFGLVLGGGVDYAIKRIYGFNDLE